MATVNQIYQEVCYDLLEDPVEGGGHGLILGLLSVQQFIDLLNETLTEFTKESGISQTIFTETVMGGQPSYPVPAPIMRPDDVFLAGVILEQSDIATLSRYIPRFRYLQAYPTSWHDDNMPNQTLELAPVPNYNSSFIRGPNFPDPPHGQFGSFSVQVETPIGVLVTQTPDVSLALTIIGPTDIAPVAALTDTIQLIPDDIALTYLAAGVLSRIFGGDSEEMDPGRADWCRNLFDEGIELMKQYFGEPGD